MSPIDARVELFYDGVWNTITDDVDMRQDISIDYGQPDEHGEAAPTRVRLRLRNADRKYSGEDPLSALYQKIGINTPLRVRIGNPQPSASLALPGLNGAYASTPDTSVLDITGDIDVRAEVKPATWRPPDAFRPSTLAARWEETDGLRSWHLYLVKDGLLRFRWSANGTAVVATVTSTAAVPRNSGRLAVRVTLDVNNGAAGNDVKFWTAAGIAGPWTQLGTTVTTAGTTSLFATSNDVTVGAGSDGTGIFIDTLAFLGEAYKFELRSGIDGTVVASPDFTAQTADDELFSDAAGRLWTVHSPGAIVVTDPSIRGTVGVTSWQPGWDETAFDAVVDVEGSGVLQQLAVGEEALRSSLYRHFTTRDDIVAYWPCEDQSDATTIAAGVGGRPLSVVDKVSLAAAADLLPASEPLPTFDTGRISGAVPGYRSELDQRVMLLVNVPAGAIAGDRDLLRITTTGTARTWLLGLQSTHGAMQLFVYGSAGVGTLLHSASVGNSFLTYPIIVGLRVTQVGADIGYQVEIFQLTSGATAQGTTITGATFGRVTGIAIGSTAGLGGTAAGHPAIQNGGTGGLLGGTLVEGPLRAWRREQAGKRIARLADEQAIPFAWEGNLHVAARLGPQKVTELTSLVDAAAATDLGPFGEQRDRLAIRYRTRESLYKQTPALTLDMADGHVTNPFDPPLDDRSIRNDITVKRDDGSSIRVERTSGPLNINRPLDDPQGVGRRKGGGTFSLDSDTRLRNQGGWRLRMGSVHQHRITSLEIEMEHHPALQQAVLELQQGDLVRLTNPLPGLPPGPLDLLALGWSETFTTETWRWQCNCAPAEPWSSVAVAEDTTHGRMDAAHSQLEADAAAGVTTLTVANGVFEGFEQAAPLLDMSTSWSRTTTQAQAGSWSLRSLAITHGQRTDAIVTIPEWAQRLAFWYRVSSESGFDFFRVFVDGVQVLEASGESGWVLVAPDTFNIRGKSILTFRYEKDASISAGDDAAYIDNVRFLSGISWVNSTDHASRFPFKITVAGEDMTVTGITGTGSSQTFTVTRAVNGISKGLKAGDAVHLAPRPVIPL